MTAGGPGGADLDASDELLREVLRGLAATPKSLPTKLLYDERGSQLFERITELEEYYPTRCELEILERHGAAMARLLGPEPAIIEYGAGSMRKVRYLLRHIAPPAAYVPVDISADFLMDAGERLASEHQGVEVIAVAGDFTGRVELPSLPPRATRTVYCPGSTIGNLTREQTVELLERMGRQTDGGFVLIGFDLDKRVDVITAAYNDSQGVTAEFNLNILSHINSRWGAGINPADFEHRAQFDERERRIVMQLVSKVDQTVVVGGGRFAIARGEAITTEFSHKHSEERFQGLAAQAGLSPVESWRDEGGNFCVALFRAAAPE